MATVLNTVVYGTPADEVEAVLQSFSETEIQEGDKVLLNESVSAMGGAYSSDTPVDYLNPGKNYTLGGSELFVGVTSNSMSTNNKKITVSTDGSISSVTANIGTYSTSRLTVQQCAPDFDGGYLAASVNTAGDAFYSVYNGTALSDVISVQLNGFFQSKEASYGCGAQPYGNYCPGGSYAYYLGYYVGGACTNTSLSYNSSFGYFFTANGHTHFMSASGTSSLKALVYSLDGAVGTVVNTSVDNVWPSDHKYMQCFPIVDDGSAFIAFIGSYNASIPYVYNVSNILSPDITMSLDEENTRIIQEAFNSFTEPITGVSWLPSTKENGLVVQTKVATDSERGQVYMQSNYRASTGGKPYTSWNGVSDQYLTYDKSTRKLTIHGGFQTQDLFNRIKSSFTRGLGGSVNICALRVNLKDRTFAPVVYSSGNTSDYIQTTTPLYTFSDPTNIQAVAEHPVPQRFGSKSLTGVVTNTTAGTDYFGHKKIKVRTVIAGENPFNDEQFAMANGLDLTVTPIDGDAATINVRKGYMKRDGVEYVNQELEGVDGATLLPQAGDTAREQYTITNNIGLAALPTDYPGATNVETIVGSGDQTMVSLPGTKGDSGFSAVAFLDETKQVVVNTNPAQSEAFSLYGSPTTTTTYSYDRAFHTRAVDKVRISCDMSTSAANYAVLSLPYEYNDITAAHERVYNVGFVAPEITGTAYTLPLFTLHDSVNNRDFAVTLSVPVEAATGYTIMVTSGDDTLIGTFEGGDFPPAGVDSCLRLWVRYDGTVTNYIAQVLTKASEHDVTLAGTMSVPMTGDQISYGYLLEDGARPVFLWSWTGVTVNAEPTAVSDNISLFNSPTHDIVAEPYLIENGMLTGLHDPYFPNVGLEVSTDVPATETAIILSRGRISSDSLHQEAALQDGLIASVSDAVSAATNTGTYSHLRGVLIEDAESADPTIVLTANGPTDVASVDTSGGRNVVQITGASDRADLSNLYVLDSDKKTGHWGTPASTISLVGGEENEVDTADFTIRKFKPSEARYGFLGWLKFIKDWGGHNAGLGDTKFYNMNLHGAVLYDKNLCHGFTFVVPSGTKIGEGLLSMNKPITVLNASDGSETVAVYVSEVSNGSVENLQVWATITKSDGTLITTPTLSTYSLYAFDDSWYDRTPIEFTVWVNAPVTKADDGTFLTTRSGVSYQTHVPDGSTDMHNSVWTDADTPFTMARCDSLAIAKHLPDTTPVMDVATAGVTVSITTEDPATCEKTEISTTREAYVIGAETNPGVYEADSTTGLSMKSTTVNLSTTGTVTYDPVTISLSGFSNTSPAYISKYFNPGSDSWEVVVKFTMTDVYSSSTYGTLIGGCTVFGLPFWLGINSGEKLQLNYSTSETANSYISGSTVLASGNTYWAKATYTGTDYTLYLSTDGVTFTQEATVARTNPVVLNGNGFLSVGAFPQNSSYTYALKGSIDLSDTYIKVGDGIWWTGLDFIKAKEVKTLNVTAHSWPVSNDSGVSYGFNSAHYALLPMPFTEDTSSFEVVVAFEDYQRNSTNAALLDTADGFRLTLTTKDGVLKFRNTTAGVDISGATAIQYGKKYWAKVTYDNVTGYAIHLSENGVDYVTEASVSNLTGPVLNETAHIGVNAGSTSNFLGGKIYLTDSYIKVNGEEVWRGAS